MQIKDMTEQQLPELVRYTVAETLDEYFGDPDEGKEVQEAFKQNLLEIQRRRNAGRTTISVEEVYQRYGLEMKFIN